MKYVSGNSRPCQTRSIVVDINSAETLFYIITVSVSKCGGSCNTTDDPYAQFFVPNKVWNIKGKLFSFISGVNKKDF